MGILAQTVSLLTSVDQNLVQISPTSGSITEGLFCGVSVTCSRTLKQEWMLADVCFNQP